MLKLSSKKNFIRTDLAIESKEIYNTSQIDGVKIITQDFKNIKVTSVKIINQIGEKNLDKPKGNYITIECPLLNKNSIDYREQVIKILSDNLKKLINNLNNNSSTQKNKPENILIIGLGNWNITADSLGPKTISKVLVTRHLKKFIPKELEIKNSIKTISAISPGVLGITGIETYEIIKGLKEKINPDLIIIIDSLAARNISRINSTIQISDTGITPGSGINNNNIKNQKQNLNLNKKSLGCDIISIGVPTVIDAGTLINDTIDKILDIMILYNKKSFEQDFFMALDKLDSQKKYNLIKKILAPYENNMLVTPKEVDDIIEHLSNIIANAINITLHEKITLQDINKFICK